MYPLVPPVLAISLTGEPRYHWGMNQQHASAHGLCRASQSRYTASWQMVGLGRRGVFQNASGDAWRALARAPRWAQCSKDLVCAAHTLARRLVTMRAAVGGRVTCDLLD